MENAYQNSTISQILEAILEQTTFTGTSNSNIADILLSILYNTPYDEEPKSVLAELFLKLKAKIENEPFEPYDKEPKSVLAEILLSILNETEYTKPATSRIGELLLQLKEELEKYAEVTVSGAICNFNTSLVKPLVNLKAYFEATQESGTPTPQSPKAISGVSAVNVVHCGANLWDEVLELGGIYSSTGEEYYANNRLRSKNYIPVQGGLSYYFFLGGEGTLAVLACYDENCNFISDIGWNMQNAVITLPNTTNFIRFQMSQTYGTTYNNDISFNYPATDTSYHAYNGNAYEIVFPPYSENLPYFEGLLAGTYGFVDLGTLNYTRSTYEGVSYFTATVPDIKAGVMLQASNVLCSSIFKTVVTQGVTAPQFVNEILFVWTSGLVYFRDDNYTDATAFKNAMQGVYLIYELAEAVTPTITPEQLQTLLRAFAGVYYGGYVEQDKDGHRKLVLSKFGFNGNDLTVVKTGTTDNLSTFQINFVNNQFPTPILASATSSHFSRSTPSGTSGRMAQSSADIFCVIDNTLLETDTALGFISWLVENDVVFYYELAEPIEIDLPDGEPIITFNGVNNIYNDSANTEVTYLTTINDNINRAVTVKRQQDRLKELEKEALKPKDEVIVEEPKPIEKELKK